jgi:pilus assembly protein CpaD
MALPAASNPKEATRQALASSLTETGLARRNADEDRTMTNRPSVDRYRPLRLFGALAGLSIALGACTSTSGEVVTASVPDDYRQRHPIAIHEADRSVVIFVGQARGGLTATQRADVMGLAQTWLREGTGAINVDVPIETPNARAAADSLREIRSLLASAGVPPRGIVVHRYHPDDPRTFAAIRLGYPRVAAVAGPCGLWPEDLGPSIMNTGYNENKQYYNFGCATQRNLAAMIDNPSDLVQPRPETAAYTARRTVAFERYRKGEPTTTSYPEADKAKLSDTGK